MAAKRKKVTSQAEKPSPDPIRLPALFLIMGMGMLLVLSARVISGEVLSPADLFPYASWAFSSVLLVGFLKVGRYSGKAALPEMILLLSAVGVLVRSRMEGRVTNPDGWSVYVQALGFLWMAVVWLATRKGRAALLKPFWGLSFLVSLGVLAGLILMGNRFRGAFYGPGGMTPGELLKLSVPLALAGYFSRSEKSWQNRGIWNPPVIQLLTLGMGWGLLCVLLFLQRDLGLLVLLSTTLLVVLMSVTRSNSWGAGFLGLLAAGAFLVLNTIDHGARRIEAWLDPFADPTGSGWQVLQGLSGLYAGGLTGTGFGAGDPARLPIAGSDFVYAVYGEETGYVGCLLLLLLFGVLLKQCREVANIQTEVFSGLFATALTAVLTVQVVVNIAGVVTLLPVTGITLPYISQGGSSIWVTSAQFGMMLGLAEPPRKKSSRKKSSRSKKR